MNDKPNNIIRFYPFAPTMAWLKWLKRFWLFPLYTFASLTLCLSVTQAATLQAQHFGAFGDGEADDWWPIQQGIDYLASHGGGTLSLPATPRNAYVIRQALRIRSGVLIRVDEPSTQILCKSAYTNGSDIKDPTGVDIAYVNRWPLYGCAVFGSFHGAANVSALPEFRVDPQRQQGNWIQLATTTDISRLKVGDLVMVEQDTTFDIADERHSTWSEMDRIEDIIVQPGKIKLRYSPSKHTPITLIRLLTPRDIFWQREANDRNPDRSIGLLQWASWRGGIVGGNWIAKTGNGDDLPFSTGDGALDCILRPYAVTAAYGVGYGNLFTNCKMSVINETISVTPLELAYSSSGNDVEIGDITLNIRKDRSDWTIALDEAAHHNNINIGSIYVANPGVKDVVSLVASQDNSINIQKVMGMPVSGSVISIFAFQYHGAYPSTEGNSIRIANSEVRPMRGYVSFGTFSVQNNVVYNSIFSGRSPDTAGVIGENPSIGNKMTNDTVN